MSERMNKERAIEVLEKESDDLFNEIEHYEIAGVNIAKETRDLLQAIDYAIEQMESEKSNLFLKRVKGKSHWRNLITGKHLEDYKAVIFDKSRNQIYVISDVITMASEPNIVVEPYVRSEE